MPHCLVAGCDEAGRGPLCGPVVAAAVMFARPPGPDAPPIGDSKQMTRAQREKAYDWIAANSVWAVGQCSPREIDEINILQASMLAMKRAVEALAETPDFVLVDGNRMPDGLKGRAVVKGDGKSVSIAAASIVAKVSRDKIMRDLAREFPQYGWDKNAGYPTKAHLEAMKKHGINRHYRMTYGPVREIADK